MSAIWFGIVCGLSLWCGGLIVGSISLVHAINKCTSQEYGWGMPITMLCMVVFPILLAFGAGYAFGNTEEVKP